MQIDGMPIPTLAESLLGAQFAAAPEPSTWAMLLVGFASVGFAAAWRRGKDNLAIGRYGSG